MDKVSTAQARAYVDFLELEGYLRTNPLHSTLEPTQAASAVLFGGRTVSMPVRADAEPPRVRRSRREAAPLADAPQDLLSALKSVRNQIALEENVPAYIVFSNATLADMAQKQPRTRAEFLEVSGVGEVKAERYAESFLAAIADYFA